MGEHSKNRKSLIVCVAILGIVTLVATIFLFSIRLEKPIFLKNYYEYNWNAYSLVTSSGLQKDFIIQYISNLDDSRSVVGIEFPDLDEPLISFHATEDANGGSDMSFISLNKNNQSSTGQNVGLYSLHTVQITVQCQFGVEERDGANFILKNALIHFDNGSTQEVNLGEIRLCVNNRDNWELVSPVQSMGNSDGLSAQTLRCDEALKVVDLRWSPLVESEGLFKFTFNGIDAASDEIKGMVFSQDEYMDFRVEFPEPNELQYKFTAYDLRVVLTLEDSNGIQKEIELNPIAHRSVLSNTWDILRYVTVIKGGI